MRFRKTVMNNKICILNLRYAGVFIAALILAVMSAKAQVTRYTFSQSQGTYAPITGGIVLATAATNYPPSYGALSGTVYRLAAGSIPFGFTLNGTSYTECYVTSSGYLTFGAVAPFRRDVQAADGSFYDVEHPLSQAKGTGYEGAIAAMAGDILGNTDAGNEGQIRHQTVGVSPNRTFVVQWSRMRFYGTAGSLNFQVRLHETSNIIDLVYGQVQATNNVSVPVTRAQVGLRGSTPNDWHNRTGTWAASTAGLANTDTLIVSPSSAPVAGLTYTFTPPAAQPCPQPFSLIATPAGTQAQLRWRAQAPSSGPYTVVYGLAGFNPATGGLGTQTVPGTNAIITGLTPRTTYDFYVTQQCGGAAGTSPFSNPPGRFRTTILNDEPVDAVPLPVAATCQPISGNSAGATRTAGNGYDPYLDCNGTSPTRADADVWFTLTTAANGPASTAMQLTPSGNAAAAVRVFRSAGGTAGPFTQLYCSSVTGGGGGGTFAPFVLAGLMPNTTYYVMVFNAGQGGPTGAFTLCATVPPACGDPVNVLSGLTTATTTATITFQPGAGAVDYTLMLTPLGGSAFVVTPRPTGAPISLTNLTPATTYTGTLQANCASGGVSASVPVTVRTRPVNDEPAGAIALPINSTCQPVTGSCNNASVSASRVGYSSGYPNTGCGRVQPYDVWYSFTTPTTGAASRAVRMQVTGADAGQMRVFARQGTVYAHLACSAAASGPAPFLDVVNLSPGTTYYVAVATYGLAIGSGLFTICATEPPACGAPQGVGVSSITATTANLTFIAGTPAPASTAYTVTLTAQGGVPATITNSGSTGSIPLTGLVAGTYYTATLQANCGATAGLSVPATVRFRTPGPPANNLCVDAVLLNCTNTRATALLAGATATGLPAATCGGVPPLGPGLWYRIVGTGDEVTVDFCAGFGDDPDLQLLIYTGSCTALTCVGSNDDSYGCHRQLPAYTFATVAGQDYYLLVADTGRPPNATTPSSGEFDLALRCTAPAAACPPPTGLAVQVLSTTSATVTWQPAAGQPAYQVIWQPLGVPGPAPLAYSVTTATAHTVTGLLPNTPYTVSVTTRCPGPSIAPLPRSRPATADFSTILGTRNPALAALVALYPNPTHGTATLEVPAALRGTAGATATLYNALGQAVRQLAVLPGTAPVRLDVVGLPTGRYLLRLATPLGAISKALVVE